ALAAPAAVPVADASAKPLRLGAKLASAHAGDSHLAGFEGCALQEGIDPGEDHFAGVTEARRDRLLQRLRGGACGLRARRMGRRFLIGEPRFALELRGANERIVVSNDAID